MQQWFRIYTKLPWLATLMPDWYYAYAARHRPAPRRARAQLPLPDAGDACCRSWRRGRC